LLLAGGLRLHDARVHGTHPNEPMLAAGGWKLAAGSWKLAAGS
jgi:hypothetical protein